MQFRPFEPNIEVFGKSIDAITGGFALFPDLALEKLLVHGIGTLCPPSPGAPEHDMANRIVIDRAHWYSQAQWLLALEEIAGLVGSSVIYKIGANVPVNAAFPFAGQSSLQGALAALDEVYHLNHRKAGKVMYDPQTKTMLEGIGHYHCHLNPEAQRLEMVCNNPYPCDLDRGLLTAVANVYDKSAQLVHANKSTCRKSGADQCVYHLALSRH